MKKTVTISNRRSSATLIVEDFIATKGDILLMTAYGPTQEVRCFAQILGSKDGELEVYDGESRLARLNDAKSLQAMQLLHKPEYCYSALSITPCSTTTIIGENEEDCFNVFSRILDQSEFVHREWYRFVWEKVSTGIPAQVGKRICYLYSKSRIDEVVKGGLNYGGIAMPASTVDLTMNVIKNESAEREAGYA